MTEPHNAEPPAPRPPATPSPHAYPVLLDVTRRRVVIVGGGAVALRKAKGLIDAGALPEFVRVVALKHREGFPPRVDLVTAEYRAEHLDGAGLVFAATDSAEVNQRVVRDAHRLHLLACRADVDDEADTSESSNDSGRGDFITPAKFTSGPVTVAVATGGNPALAAMIRDELRRRFEDGWARLASAIQSLRPEIRRHPRLSIDERHAIFRELASAEALDVIANGTDQPVDELRHWLKKKHPAL